VGSIELYILWSELNRRKLSPTLATAHSCPDNAIGLVAHVNLAGMLNWASFGRQLGGNFHTDLATLPQLEWPSVGDTAGYRIRRP